MGQGESKCRVSFSTDRGKENDPEVLRKRISRLSGNGVYQNLEKVVLFRWSGENIRFKAADWRRKYCSSGDRLKLGPRLSVVSAEGTSSENHPRVCMGVVCAGLRSLAAGSVRPQVGGGVGGRGSVFKRRG